MTAVNALAFPTGAYLMTDTACYSAESDLITSFPSKVFTFPHLSLAIASTGSIVNCEYLASRIRQFDCFEAAIAGLSDMVREAWEDGALEVGDDDTLSHVRLMMAGWSETNKRGEVYVVSTKDEGDTPAFALVSRAFMASPAAMSIEAMQAAGFMKVGKPGLNILEPAAFLNATIHYQRKLPWPVPGSSDDVKYIVGGAAVLTTINAAGITQRVVHRWPDVIGEPIDPIEPVADTTGLSRMAREMARRKTRKALRAA